MKSHTCRLGNVNLAEDNENMIHSRKFLISHHCVFLVLVHISFVTRNNNNLQVRFFSQQVKWIIYQTQGALAQLHAADSSTVNQMRLNKKYLPNLNHLGNLQSVLVLILNNDYRTSDHFNRLDWPHGKIYVMKTRLWWMHFKQAYPMVQLRFVTGNVLTNYH